MAGTWNTTTPDGSKSVKKNETILQNNTTYIKTNMAWDHYWAESATKDGYHKQVSMGVQSSDPTLLPSDIDGEFYIRNKTAAEAPTVQLPEPFYYQTPDGGTTNYYLQLGFRALAHFTVTSGTLTQTYAHNCTITRSAKGRFTLSFTVALPSDNYIVMGGGVRNSSTAKNYGNLNVIASTTKAGSMTTSNCYLVFGDHTQNIEEDPIAGWVAVVGG